MNEIIKKENKLLPSIITPEIKRHMEEMIIQLKETLRWCGDVTMNEAISMLEFELKKDFIY
jgi:hypothetical protein